MLEGLFGAGGSEYRIALATAGRGGSSKDKARALDALLNSSRLEESLLLVVTPEVAEFKFNDAVPADERGADRLAPFVILFKQLHQAEAGRHGRKDAGRSGARPCAAPFQQADHGWCPLMALQHGRLSAEALLVDSHGCAYPADPTDYGEAPILADIARLAASLLVRCVPLLASSDSVSAPAPAVAP